jgi:hypothetical protein
VVGLPLKADIPLIGKFHEPVPLLTFDGGKIARLSRFYHKAPAFRTARAEAQAL